MKYNKIGIESDFLSNIIGFKNIFNFSKDPSKEIELGFKNFEKTMKEEKNVPTLKASLLNNIIIKLTLWNYNNKINGSMSKSYIKEIEDTQGYYSKRSNVNVQKTVYDMFDFITNNYKKSSYNTIFDLYIRLFDLIIRNRDMMNMFNTAYKYKSKGNEIFSLIYVEYVMMVFVLEYMTLTLSEFMSNISETYSFEKANKDYCDKYSSFINIVCKNIIKILVKNESIKDKKKYIYSIIENEKKKSGNESEIFKNENETSKESLVGILLTTAIVGSVSVVGLMLAIDAIRNVIYYVSCLKIDITKSLEIQSNLLLVNISKLKIKLSTLKEGAKDYIDLKKVIEKQEKYTNILIDISKKLSDNDVNSISDIKELKSDDDENIKDTLDSETESGSTSDFDI